MDDIISRALVSDPETRRALQLDTLSAILPMERRDRLAVSVLLLVDLAIPADRQLQVLGERVHDRDADAVETS